MYRRLMALGVAALVSVLLPAPVFAAAPTKQVWASVEKKCASGRTPVRAHFTITNISAPPDSISVNTAISSFEASLNGHQGNIAHYDTPVDAAVKSAFAYVPSAWRGSFQLASLSCTEAAAPSISTEHVSCGVEPRLLTVRVTNNTSSFVTYNVTVGRFPERRLGVGGHRTEAVDFGPVKGGEYKVAAEGSDGTDVRVTISIELCGATPTSAPPTTRAASPTPSRSPSPTPTTASPSPTESSPTPAETESEPEIQPDFANAEPASRGGSSGMMLAGLCVGGTLLALGAGLIVLIVMRRRA